MRMVLAATCLLACPAFAADQPSPAERAAIFKAAGFVQRGSDWRSRDCEGLEGASYTPGSVDIYTDLNGDGRADAVISEGSGICYGITGTHFWLLSKQSTGSWTVMLSGLGIAEPLRTMGAGGWPDILVGGPGFCFPVYRWNGTAYARNRFEYEGKKCNRPT